MVLNHIADGACFFIELPTSFDAEILRHVDLYGADVSAIPQRVREIDWRTACKECLDRLLAQEVVNPEDG